MPKREAKRIYNDCYNLIDRYKIREPVLHHEILARNFALMIVDEKLKEISVKQRFTKDYLLDVKEYLKNYKHERT